MTKGTNYVQKKNTRVRNVTKKTKETGCQEYVNT